MFASVLKENKLNNNYSEAIQCKELLRKPTKTCQFKTKKILQKRTTVWHEIFAGVYFGGLAIFCVLRELISGIRTGWFFLLGINFCDFQKVPITQH